MYNALYYACFIEETLALASAIKAGAEKVAGITRERYVHRLVWLRAVTRLHIATKQDDRQKLSFVRINNVLQNLRLDSADGTLRKQPYCIVLCGFPGCGKTGTAIKIAEALMKSRHGKFYSTDVVTLNETDEFQSEYRTNHKVVIFDDVAADREKPSTVNPWRKIIDFVNNIRKTALNPNLELKGNVYIEPELIIITTNRTPSHHFGISLHMKCTDAITRRFSEVLFLHSDYHSCTPMSRSRPNGLQTLPATGMLTSEDTFDGQSSYTHDKQMSIYQKIEEMTISFNQKMDEQEEFISNVNDLFQSQPRNENAIVSFYHDMIRPYWFKKLNLPVELENQLPWYSRLIRKVCVNTGKQILIAQAGEVDRVAIAMESRVDPRQYYLNQYFNVEHFYVLSPAMRGSAKYCPVPGGFDGFRPILLPGHATVYHQNLPFLFTYEELYDEFNRRVSVAVDNLPFDHDDDEMPELIDEKVRCALADPTIETSMICQPCTKRMAFTSENMTFPLNGFRCNPPRDDCFMTEFLETQPPSITLVLREWVSDCGIGDFVFLYLGRDMIPQFIVMEVKQHRFEIACAQSRKYGNELLRLLNIMYKGQKKVLAVAATGDDFQLTNIFGMDAAGMRSANTFYTRWHENFVNRCKAGKHPEVQSFG